MPPKTNEYITLYDLRGPWAEESAKKIILQRINTKIDTIIKEKDKEREEAVAEARREFKSLEASWMALKDDYSEICRALGFKGDSWFGDPLVDHAEIIAKAKALSHPLDIY